MLSSVKKNVYIYHKPTDMRKSYDSLCGLIRSTCDVLSGDIFLFVSKDRQKAKALFWDGTGFNIWMKRLEKGQFANILSRKHITTTELKLFLEGSRQVNLPLSPKDQTHKYSV